MKKLMFALTALLAVTFVGCGDKKEAKEDPAAARARAIAEGKAKYAAVVNGLDYSEALPLVKGVLTEKQIKDLAIRNEFTVVTSCRALEYTLKALVIKMMDDAAAGQLNEEAMARKHREALVEFDQKLRPLKDFSASNQSNQLKGIIESMAFEMKMSAGQGVRVVE